MKTVKQFAGAFVFVILMAITALVLPVASMAMFIIWMLMGGTLDDFVTGSYALLLIHLANVRKVCERFY